MSSVTPPAPAGTSPVPLPEIAWVMVRDGNRTLGGGKAVADAILNTWIGPKPGPGNDFKKGVLAQ